ncbi:MAG: DUF285 domain-containing protein [Bacteroidales bacterium]|nr:DUF285 domain-containing protein [Bacteroidales bacterium]
MKRLFYIAATAMAVLSACTKEDPIVEVGTEPESVSMPVFKATIEDHATKTTLGEGNKVNWENGDEVLMALGIEDDGASAVYIYEATPGVDASSATLSHKADVMVLDPNADKFVMAIYPASILSLGEGYIFPATQTYNGEDISFAPMFSMPSFLDPETPNNIVFKNGAALLKITVPHTQMANLTSITVSSDLVMNGEVCFDAGGYMYIGGNPDVTSENSKITLNIPSGIAIPEGESKTFYIAIPPMSENTQETQADHYGYLQIDVTDGTTTKRMRTTKAEGIQVERNKIYPINFSANYVVTAAWETALTLGRSFSGATSIEIQTGVNVSSYTEDATHKKLNAAGTLWEFLDGQVLRIQTSADKIIAPVNSSGLFRKYYKVESIANLNKLDMSGVTDMSSMFADCYELTSIALPVNTGSVADMNYMFYNCVKLQSITGIDNLNTGSVTNMYGMFKDCPALSALDVTHFDTQNVTNMSQMFNGCGSLSALDVTHFDTQNVSNMGGMFAFCSALTELDVTNFDTQNVTNMSYMFNDCQNLSALDVAYFNTSNVTDMSNMFAGCETLESLDITSFDTRSVENMQSMFFMCTNLTSLRIGENFSMSNVTNKWDMFQDCGSYAGSFCVYAVNNDDGDLENALSNGTGWDYWYMQFEPIWE